MAKARKDSVDNIAECNRSKVCRKRATGKLDIISLPYDIAGRKGIEHKFLKVNEELEQRVAERTAELKRAYERLKQEVEEHKRAEKKLAVYHRQLQALASEMFLLEERQRRNIAADLHDRIGQSLNLVRLKLESARKSAVSRELAKDLAEINTAIGHIIDDTHSLEFELSPPLLYELGMEEAVSWLLEQIQTEHGIQCVLEVDKGPNLYLNTNLRTILYRMVQEMLTNVVKHARASAVRVSIKEKDNTLRVIVADDGAGFETSQGRVRISKKGGFGLFSIRERLKYFDGDFDIKSKTGCGTVITITVPLNG